MSTNGDLARRCHAITKKGEACRAEPLHNSDYCLAHSDADTRASVGFTPEAGKLGGRPRVPRATELMRERAEEERERIVGVYFDAINAMKSGYTTKDGEYVEGGPDHAIRLQALRDLLDRVYGKPTTRTELTGDLTLDLTNLAQRAVEPYEEAG